MNVITDAAAQERGGSFKQELGAWGFLKSTLSYQSGLIMDDKLALSATLVKKTGDGYTFGTWTDAYAYYFGASYMLNDQAQVSVLRSMVLLKGMARTCIKVTLLPMIGNSPLS